MGEPRAVNVRRGKLGPFKCYFEAKEFLGDQYWLFLGICLVGMIVGGFVPVLLIGPAYAGIAICFLARANKQQVVFDQLFKGFDYFGPTLIASLLYVGGTIVLFIPFAIALIIAGVLLSTQEAAMVVPAILLYVIAMTYWMLVISVATMVFMFTILLSVDKKLDPWPATTLAIKGVFKNFFGIIGTASVGQAIYFIGVMMCFVPGILAIPLVFGGHFIAYWKIFGVEASSVVSQTAKVGPVDKGY